MCYSILYFTPSTEKNDSSVVLKSLNPEGPSGSYLCDVTLPALLIRCQFLFCVIKKIKQDFLPGDKTSKFLSFLQSIFLVFLVSVFLCSFISSPEHEVLMVSYCGQSMSVVRHQQLL